MGGDGDGVYDGIGAIGALLRRTEGMGAGIARLTEMAAHDRILTPKAQIKDRISYIPLLGTGHTDIFHRRGVIATVIVDIAESPVCAPF